MTGEVKVFGSTAGGDGVSVNQRLNKAREAINTPWETQMMLEGRVFVAGTGAEETGIAGIAALDIQTPVFALVAPAGGVVLVPLWFKAYYDTEGAAAPAGLELIYCQLTKAAFSAGTELPAINCLGGSNPRTAQGKFQHTLTSLTDITSAQNVALTQREHILDNLQSGEMIATDANIERFDTSTMELNWTPPCPIGLYKGSLIAFYAIDATSRYNASMAWVELPADNYLP